MSFKGGGNLPIITIFCILPFVTTWFLYLFTVNEIIGIYLSLIIYLAGFTTLMYSKRKKLIFFKICPGISDNFDKKIYYVRNILIFLGLCSLFAWCTLIVSRFKFKQSIMRERCLKSITAEAQPKGCLDLLSKE